MTAGKIILVVDDDETILELITDGLAEEGFTVWPERNGFEALVTIDRLRPALVICDVMMPRLSGLDLLKATRNRPETREIPFIMVSAMDSAEAVQTGLALGAVDYLTKPFKASELLGKVRFHLADR